MLSIERFVIASTRFVHFHKWPDAPKAHRFLRLVHRHEFHVRMWVHVEHNERDVEFCKLKDELDQFVRIRWPNDQDAASNDSCETIAEHILTMFRAHAVEVLEDGENGAYLQQAHVVSVIEKDDTP
jgi:hypothetical protein